MKDASSDDRQWNEKYTDACGRTPDLLQFHVLADDGCPHFPEEDELAREVSLVPAIAELERAFRAFCGLAFKRHMPMPVITIQTAGRKNAAAWFWREQWLNGERNATEGGHTGNPVQDGGRASREGRLPEINICAEQLGRSVEDLAQFLLHEMCHMANYLDGIRDCTASQYHNRHFQRRCHSIGLVCKKGPRGFAYTSLSPQLREIVGRVAINPGAFAVYRRSPFIELNRSLPELVQKGTRRLRRWTCGCKKSRVIYASRGLDVTCNQCVTRYAENPRA